MSNYLAVATTTETIAQVIRDAVSPVIPGAEVTTDRPDKAAKDSAAARVNVYLYQVGPNPALRNADLPLRRADGTLESRPRTALDLYYLISFYGRDEQLVSQQLLGLTAASLHLHAMLSREDVLRAIRAAPGGFLDGSNLAEQTESIKISPHTLTVEDLSRLWTMFQVPYTVSASYQVSVVIIDGPPAPAPLPVRAAAPAIRPSVAPTVTSVAAADAGSAIVMGSSIVIRGSGLSGPGTTVVIGDVVLTPAATDVTDTQVTVALTDSRLVSGTLSLVVAAAAGTTPPASFVLSPSVTAVSYRKAKSGGSPSLRVTLDPSVWTTDPLTVLLNGTQGSGGAPAPAYAFDAPVPNAEQAPKRVQSVTVPIDGVVAGTYLVRVQVNGAESPLATATGSDGKTRYAAPKVKVS
jgi:hypothetical protein